MINKKFLFLLTAFIAVSLSALAQGPNNSGTYYKNANGKKGAELKTALYNIISPHTNIGYDGLYEAYKQTDKRADGYLRDWYSNATNYTWNDKGGNSSEGAGWNREHTVPQSWFGSGLPKSDVVQVVPTDCWVNGMRSNYPLAEVGTVEKQSKNGYSKLGSCKTAGYSGKVFEPNDEIKGDLARIYFYMVTCYENLATGWGHSVFSTSKYPGFMDWYLTMLMRWSKQDPVDEVERARNNAVWSVQANRNPFVDYPGLEDYVWGDKKTEAFSYDHYNGGNTPDVTTVSQPVFSPEEGSYANQVVVSMTSATEGATIYYTTNNANATVQSNVYEGPITLTETTTLKAIAVKDGTSSYQTIATYTITDGQGGETPAEGLIAFGNQLFGTSYDGSLTGDELRDYSGTQNGVTVTYSKGEGANQYINDSQIRLYQKNRLVISVGNGYMTKLEFQLAKETSKVLKASTGTVADLTWTGKAQSVTFSVNDGSGNMQLSGVKVTLDSQTEGIDAARTTGKADSSFRTLHGTRVSGSSLRPGIYIHKGKKIVVK
ncbi:MAG: endonuclease [Prevotella sp.]|nr:endonuclease [Prevotella sp.]